MITITVIAISRPFYNDVEMIVIIEELTPAPKDSSNNFVTTCI
jgi:hypothetical protein